MNGLITLVMICLLILASLCLLPIFVTIWPIIADPLLGFIAAMSAVFVAFYLRATRRSYWIRKCRRLLSEIREVDPLFDRYIRVAVIGDPDGASPLPK
jgi:uncharacterized membrane protein YccC